jgi:acyl-CoA thioesterase
LSDEASSARPDGRPGTLGDFDRDTAVQRVDGTASDAKGARRVSFAGEVKPGWRAGRGPHGGYLAAMLLRALCEAVGEPARAPRSLTIHYARAPKLGPLGIETVLEREGRSLSTLSARVEQDGSLMALALAAFSVAWSAPEIAEASMPRVAPPDDVRETSGLGAERPEFVSQLVVQRRLGAAPFVGSDAPMETGAWLGLRDPSRPVDALSLALFSDALFSPPFARLSEPATTPTVDLTVHFRTRLPLVSPDAASLCFARFRSRYVHEGFFEEDGAIWAADGTLLAQSRQLAILMALPRRD